MINDQEEIWLPINVGLLGSAYSVSNFGRIKRVAGGQGSKKRILKQKFNKKNKYLYVILCVNGKPKTYAIHRLVAETFCQKPQTDELLEVAHNDGNRQNNIALNLRWATRKENIKDKLAHGTQLYGLKVASAKLSYDDVLKIKNLVSLGVRRVEVAKQFNIHEAYVGSLVRGEWRKHEQFLA